MDDSMREAALFEAALQKPEIDRAAFLDGACHGDAPLRERLQALLEAHSNPDDRIAGAGAWRKAEGLALEASDLDVSMAVGQTVGPYKLLEKLGEGGCGVVYVAEQSHPVRRRVALKVIKLGMDTKQVVARFEAERQALAMMDHPNIARVLDAGSTGTGRPYFVMELVRGIRITEYCDRTNLTPNDRLALFIKVCQAIQHAHQKGIIHRDVKPSNILVTLHDGVPVPKVIDFGIAKAVEGRLTDATVYTQLHHFIGTPAYISPEQAEMSGLDVDTRSDIYSLGVLLYELLTGRTPFDGQELLAGGLDAMRHTIREREPERPSTRLSTYPGAELTTVAKRRSVETSRLVHLLKGDLDWIVMKCLEKDRARRYDTANGLAMDIVRYLSNEPVVARPPSASYRFQKAFRRNRVGFTAAFAIALTLLVGAIVSTILAERATAQRRIAEGNESRAVAAEKLAASRLAESESARRDSDALATFLTSVFRSPDPSRDGRTVTVAEMLGRASRQLETNQAVQPPHRARMQATLGRTYLSLGLARDAVPLFERVRDHCVAEFGKEHAETLRALGDLAEALSNSGRLSEALDLREERARLSRKILGLNAPGTIQALEALAASYADSGRKDEALRLRIEVLDWYRRERGPEDLGTVLAMAAVADMTAVPAENLRLRREIYELMQKSRGPEDPGTIGALGNLALAFGVNGDGEESVRLHEQTLALSRKVLGPEHQGTLRVMGNLAVAYQTIGQPRKGLALLEETTAIRRRTLGVEHPDTLGAMGNLAAQYSSLGQPEKAIDLWEETLPLRRRIVGPDHPQVLLAMDYLWHAYTDAGRTRQSLALRREALDWRRRINGVSDAGTQQAFRDLEAAYTAAGRPEEAAKLREEWRAVSDSKTP